jgi:hypothetical protein
MASPISNFVVLEPGVPVEMHFSDHSIVRRFITDPVRNVGVTRESLMFYVDEVDGSPADKVYSVLSQKLAGDFAGYLGDKSYRRYRFTLIKDAAGFVPPRIVTVRPI